MQSFMKVIFLFSAFSTSRTTFFNDSSDDEIIFHDFKKNLMDIYLFMDYVLKNVNVMNEYDVD